MLTYLLIAAALWALFAATLFLAVRRKTRPARPLYCLTCSGPLPRKSPHHWYCCDDCRDSMARVVMRRLNPEAETTAQGIPLVGCERAVGVALSEATR
jgi:hypothetical protein